MKHLQEYRNRDQVCSLNARIHARTTQPWTLMEICGGQTHAILRFGIDQMLPAGLTLIHGPGCPVCVTPAEMIDAAVQIAHLPGIVLCTFGDMLRVPGTAGTSLYTAKARGADVRFVYSPIDVVRMAESQPDRCFVFFGVGFETTAPAQALAVLQAERLGLRNFFLLGSLVRVLPAIEALLGEADCRLDGLLAAGHVCAITGFEEYRQLAQDYQVPINVTGFEPTDILRGILGCVTQLEEGRAEVENNYERSVRSAGNRHAREMIHQVFEVCDRAWRGLGPIAQSGLRLRAAYHPFDALQHFEVRPLTDAPATTCISGKILRGQARPCECPAFGSSCTPEMPLGAPMVSGEGACAAYFRYARPAAPLPEVLRK
ncbi:MAG: hydrogenase formation protein HypD [Candidatus Hydrogenedentes bacterium]|nr:hydrogenase formation protein HypD [Candidatus Hydrogenedentota bacterium]